MDHTSHHVLDAWIGYYIHVSDREQEAIESAKGSGQPMSMEAAGQFLSGKYGTTDEI